MAATVEVNAVVGLAPEESHRVGGTAGYEKGIRIEETRVSIEEVDVIADVPFGDPVGVKVELPERGGLIRRRSSEGDRS